MNKNTLSVVLLAVVLFLLSGCIAKNNIEINLKNPKKSEPVNITISNVQVINHQIIYENNTGILSRATARIRSEGHVGMVGFGQWMQV